MRNMEYNSFELRELWEQLERDRWRDANPFAPDMELAGKVLGHPYSSDGDRDEALNLWVQRHQPCLFGRVAAAANAMHYCYLTDNDLRQSDEHVAKVIRAGILSWKRRSLRPTRAFSNPAHGFTLLVISPRVAYARPDGNLRRFAQKLRDIWNCPSGQAVHGAVHLETLYLEHPKDKSILKFTFSVDFFAAQGDGRWWQDHRIPGGIAFTANSAGHMRRYREWYNGKENQVEWLLKTAMETIEFAAETPYGRATWLKPLDNGRPIVERLACPFSDPDKLKDKLKGKDWTRYGGHLHTDHSIRSEFFDDRPEKSAQVKRTEFLQDFAYIFDPSAADHVRFIHGQNVSREEVINEVGDPEFFANIVGPKALRFDDGRTITTTGNPEVRQLLAQCAKWRMTEAELNEYVNVDSA